MCCECGEAVDLCCECGEAVCRLVCECGEPDCSVVSVERLFVDCVVNA